MSRLFSLKHQRKRVLLVYFGQIVKSKENTYMPAAPLGLFMINGYLKKLGYKTKILHVITAENNQMLFESNHYKERLKKEIVHFNPDYVGFSFRNLLGIEVNPALHTNLVKKSQNLISICNAFLEKEYIDFMRSIISAPFIGGGSAFSISPLFHMQYLGLDYGIVGEGEESFAELLDHLASDKPVEKIAGLAYYQNGHLIINENRFLTNFAKIPPMDVGKLSPYRKLYLTGDKIANIQTKRGCAFHCIYCSYQYLEGNEYRLRNIDTIIEEIKIAKKKYHTHKIFFTDSVFSYPTEFSRQLCRRLIENKVKIQWEAYINPKGVTEELINLYKKSGCSKVVFTPDALTEKVLQAYRKGFTLDEVTNCIRLLRKEEIPFTVSLIIGGPGEDEDTIDETIQYCDKYLRDIDIWIMCGMNLHFSNIVRQKANLEKTFRDIANIDLGEVLLNNDFAEFQRLKYFFPQHGKNNTEFLKRIFKKIIAPQRMLIGCDPITQEIVDKIVKNCK